MPQETTGEPQFGNMVRQMGKLVEQMHKGFYSFCPAETWTPAVNVYENDIAYVVCVDLSGVEKDKIELTVHEHHLRLRGQRTVPIPPDTAGTDRAARMRVHTMEIDHGPFVRDVELPADVAQEHISARYLDGMLWVELPRKS